MNRNIPAYAGKTFAWTVSAAQRPEHPRVCGENPTHATPRVPQSGTSPRMRGKPSRCGYGTRWTRNIPAYAGKTSEARRRRPRPPEHPRVCGENLRAPASRVRLLGTSPRMRGKRIADSTSTIRMGNIPAYAGKTLQLQPDQVILEEHPRVCGENCFIIIAIIFACGTSPRMRGKLPKAFGRMWDHRNIPAYAGKTPGAPHLAEPSSEHPRVCGENVSLLRGLGVVVGTSPRMRGKPSVRVCSKTTTREHPRVCGEN